MSASPERPVRVRFAPSPTGYLHIGGARTALFNWLFARKHGGTFILRVEDTDQKRYVPDSEQDIKDNLRWLGLTWDEGPDVGGAHGPYHQSQRSDLYRQWADWLVEHGYAYRCNCTAERLEDLRKQQEASKQTPGYDRHCRDLHLGAEIGEHVVRFQMPLDGETTINDLIRGPISFRNADLQDLVLLKSDGLPTYHLANVVDDHFMEISHILRADEWIATAPLHAQLYAAFGWEMPQIAHLPVILSPSGKGKLSKRDQAFQDGTMKVLVQVREYRRAGYLPEAVVNWLTNIGWAFGDDREIFPVAESIPRFDLANVNPAGGKLPFEKLEWLNGQYMQMLSVEDLAARVRPFFEQAGLAVDDDRLRRLVPLIRERIKTLPDAVEMAGFVFLETVTLEDPKQLVQKGMDAAGTVAALRAAHETLAGLAAFSAAAQEPPMRQLCEALGLKPGQLFGAVRVAVTAQQVSPPLFETMEIIGQATCLTRIRAAADRLEQLYG
ncbi:MAG: glutamate--tRNA ligase [Anaerolineae bacterium]|nr:glutamate--tRNA ligase [Anaerolineae bacterium]